jgi:hypothetical protein
MLLTRFARRAITKVAQIIEIRRVNGRKLDPARVALITPESLLFYFGNIHSQRGQDGILAEIFRRLGIADGMFVEFGAWDGVYLSNCRYLVERGWGGLFIEGDSAKYRALAEIYGQSPNIKTLNAMVGTGSLQGSRFGVLLDHAGIAPSKVTFLSIDVDGPDLEIFEDMEFTPPVVLIEGGFNFTPSLVRAIPVELARRNMQQPLAVIVDTAQKRGYRAVCFYQDTYLVREDLAASFMRVDARALYADAFNFMPNGFRRDLLDLRDRSTVIRKYECESLGRFEVDPLTY